METITLNNMKISAKKEKVEHTRFIINIDTEPFFIHLEVDLVPLILVITVISLFSLFIAFG